jgi:hypothetical protein
VCAYVYKYIYTYTYIHICIYIYISPSNTHTSGSKAYSWNLKPPNLAMFSLYTIKEEKAKTNKVYFFVEPKTIMEWTLCGSTKSFHFNKPQVLTPTECNST